MKKMLIMAAVVATFAFYSCGNNQKAQSEAESEEAVVGDDVIDAAKAAIADLQAAIDSKDPAKIEEALKNIKESVGEYTATNTEAAKAYLSEVQTWLNDNKDKVTEATAGSKELGDEIASLTSSSAEDIVSDIQSAGDNAIDEAKEKAEEAIEGAKDNVKEKVNNAADEAKDKASSAVDDAKNKALDKLK